MRARNWIVKVAAGQWMAGVHRFVTYKSASTFFNKWIAANGGTAMPKDITSPRKEVAA